MVTKKAKKEHEWFDEFYASYPSSVVRPNGTKDWLRGNITKCRELYRTIVGTDETIHKTLLSAINKEVGVRTAQGSLAYIRLLINWLRNEEWKVWEENEPVGTAVEKPVLYGTDLK
jgi:hypothetical protein